jgi:hypothetical protein
MYGQDNILLHTRAWVLRSANFLVLCAGDYATAEDLIFRHDTEVVVLCHSVPDGDRDSLRSAMQELRPLIRCLLLVSGAGIADVSHNEAIVDTTNGPMALILALRQVVSGHPKRSETLPRLSTFLRG